MCCTVGEYPRYEYCRAYVERVHPARGRVQARRERRRPRRHAALALQVTDLAGQQYVSHRLA
jgi:hypothetical protein